MLESLKDGQEKLRAVKKLKEEGKLDLDLVEEQVGTDLDFIAEALNQTLEDLEALIEASRGEVEPAGRFQMEHQSEAAIKDLFREEPVNEAVSTLGKSFSNQRQMLLTQIGEELGLSDEEIDEAIS